MVPRAAGICYGGVRRSIIGDGRRGGFERDSRVAAVAPASSVLVAPLGISRAPTLILLVILLRSAGFGLLGSRFCGCCDFRGSRPMISLIFHPFCGLWFVILARSSGGGAHLSQNENLEQNMFWGKA
ncbi:hypothetical protein EJB05_16049, partial [Eragrostis curvula]